MEEIARGFDGSEVEIEDTSVFDVARYFDVTIEYAKASPDDTRATYYLLRGPTHSVTRREIIEPRGGVEASSGTFVDKA